MLWLINHQNLVTSIGNNLMLASGGVCLLLMAFVAGKVVRGVSDWVVAVLLLGVFVIFFWAPTSRRVMCKMFGQTRILIAI